MHTTKTVAEYATENLGVVNRNWESAIFYLFSDSSNEQILSANLSMSR